MKLIYYVSTTFLFLLFAYSVVQYIRKSNKDKNELYSLISLGIFLFVFFTDFNFLDFINKQFKYLIEFLLLSFSTYLFSLIFKNSDNKWTYYLFSLFTVLLFLMAIVNVNIRMYNFDDIQCTVIPSAAYGFVTGMNLQLC